MLISLTYDSSVDSFPASCLTGGDFSASCLTGGSFFASCLTDGSTFLG